MSVVAIEGVEQQATPGDLNAHLAGDKLLVPRDIAQAFRRQGVRSAEDLMSYMQSFPSAVAATLHWSAQDVSRATARLRTQLVGHVALGITNPSGRRSPAFGARNPDDLP